MSWETFAVDVIRWVWETTLSASLLIILVGLIFCLFHRSLSPGWRSAFGLIILIRLVFPSVPEGKFGAHNFGYVFDFSPSVLIAFPFDDQIDSAVRAESAKVGSQQGLFGPKEMRHLASAIWLSGAVLILTAGLLSYRSALVIVSRGKQLNDPQLLRIVDEAKRLLGLKCQLSILSSSEIPVPSLFGYVRPRILLPSGLSYKLTETELKFIILHELAHVKRADILLNWLVFLVQTLHWFNPPLWLAMRRFRMDRESVCDAIVLNDFDRDHRRPYGDTLIRLAAASSIERLPSNLIPIIDRKYQLETRLKMIANPAKTNWRATLLSAVSMMAIMLLTFTGAADSSGRITEGNEGVQRSTAASLEANKTFTELKTEPTITKEEKLLFEELIALIKTDKSVAIEKLSSKITPDSSAALNFTLGNLLFESGELEAAKAQYSTAIEKFPNFKRAHSLMGKLHIKLGEPKKSIPYFLRAIELGDIDHNVFGLLGFVYLITKEAALAESYYGKALEIEAENKEWKLGLAKAFIAQDKWEELEKSGLLEMKEVKRVVGDRTR